MNNQPPTRQNRLAHESSPYLRQHMNNPVDWYPWGPEALERARREDLPIFLSIGYSACHWCHVMAHESFEDQPTAALMNREFVCIKLDREERPDLDALYMRSVSLMTGSGGWPLSVFLTPGLEPFYGGTYFPPEPRHGMPSFTQVLESVVRAFRSKRDEIQGSAEQILEAVNRSFQPAGEGEAPGAAVSAMARTALMGRFDAAAGGFGGGPKFPQPALLKFLLDEADRAGDAGLRENVCFTLRAMERGGLRDQVGGGFHRYSVDGQWRVPHYEKMLYDNAQLASLYFRAFLVTGDEDFDRVGREVLGDLRVSMAAHGGGFVAALDADSEGEEGKFYLWTPLDLEAVLGPDEGVFMASLYGIAGRAGLAERTPHRTIDWTDAARNVGQGEEAFRHRVKTDLERLRAAREGRVHPGVDTKVLTDWNALAAEAFLDGYLASWQEEDLAMGLATLDLLWERCWRDGKLFHVWDGQHAKVFGFLADYAYLARAECLAYEATGDGGHLEKVERLLQAAADRFRDKTSGSWVDAPAGPENEGLLVAVRDTDDGVLPAGLSILAQALRFWERLTNAAWTREALDSIFREAGGSLSGNPGAQPLLAGLAADRALPSVEVVVAAREMASARPLLEAARRAAPTGALVLPLVGAERPEGLSEMFPLFRGRHCVAGAVAFVCVDGACRPPTADPSELREILTAAGKAKEDVYLTGAL
jgi:uncharacterized protein YyaL (SSP411 family)